jgi:aminoglycoside phosphotransferase (APT) family kinase protein
VTDADVGRGLLEYLRARLGEPTIEFLEPPTRISGGFDTRIFAFRLRQAPPALAGPLILRLLGSETTAARALREAVTQNTIAQLGYPAPRALLATADTAPLGGAFLIMERLPGQPLTKAGLWSIRRILLEMQLKLHALDADVLLQALAREDLASVAAGGPALGREAMTVDGHLGQLERRITGGALHGLAGAITWLLAHRPPEPKRRVICHGDFHPQNILVSGGVASGVIDWPNTMIADAAYEVAATKTFLTVTPVEVLGLPAALRWIVAAILPGTVKRYVRGYLRARPIEPKVLAYYEALSCMRSLVRTSENRLRSGRGALNPLDASSFGEALAARFGAITGVAPTVPPVKT